MTDEILNTFKNKIIDDTTNPSDLDFTPQDEARLTKDHAKSPLAHSPSELGEPTKTNLRTDRGSDKIARAADSTVKPRNNKIFGAD